MARQIKPLLKAHMPASTIYLLTQPTLEMGQTILFAQSHMAVPVKRLTVWRKVITKYADSKPFITKLKKAESAWIIYRDKYLESIWPNPDPNSYGDAYSLCRSGELIALTSERTKYLKAILNHSAKSKPVNSTAIASCDAALMKNYRLARKAPNPDEPLFAKKFQQAQQAWTSFRDADADAWQELDASAADPAASRNSRIIELDQARTKESDQWVHGSPEGSVCVGTRVTH